MSPSIKDDRMIFLKIILKMLKMENGISVGGKKMLDSSQRWGAVMLGRAGLLGGDLQL